MAHQLESKTTIPMVAAKLEFILEVQTPIYWEGITLEMMELLRLNLRNLIQFVDRASRQDIYTDFEDELGEMKEVQAGYSVTGVNIAQYKKMVEQFVRSHEKHRVIRKIHFAMALTQQDLEQLEEFFFEADDTRSKEDFRKAYPDATNLPEFIRSLVGLDRKTAKQAFTQFLDESVYTVEQIRFVNFIIDNLARNGMIKEELLFEDPFTESHPDGLAGVFPEEAENILAIVRRINAAISPSA